MFQVKLLDTDVFDLSLNEAEQVLDFEAFCRFCEDMQEGQHIHFALLDAAGQQLLRVSYLKYSADYTIKEAIEKKVKAAIKGKKLTKKQSKEILYSLFPDRKDLKKIPAPKKNLFLRRNKPHEEAGSDPKTFQRFDKDKTISRKLKGVLMGLFLFTISVYFSIHLFQKLAEEPSIMEPEATFETDLIKGTPKELGEKYPQRLLEIEQYYLDEQDFSALQAFNRQYPTVNGEFDVAFYKEDWEKVIETEVNDLTTERKVMLAHAYIQLGKLEEAEILNATIKSKTLTNELDAKYFESGLAALRDQEFSKAKEHKEKIKSTETQGAYQEYLDNAEIMRQMIDLYQEKKDEANQKLWERKLENIGKEDASGT